MTSLVDDDEDIPTTVATRDHMQELGVQQAPAPRASGRPQQPRLEPHQLGSSPQRGALPGSLRATTMGLGSTIAIPAAEAQRAGFPTHAPMPSSRPMMGPGNGPPPLGMAHGPLASGPPANKGSSTRPPPPTFGPPPPSSSSGVMHAVHPNAFGQTIAMPPQSHPGLFANPGDPQGYGAPYGAPDSFPGASSNFPGGPYGHGPPHASSSQSTIETALSLPRPDAAAMWMAQQARVSPMRDKNTLVLIAVAVLTAICVLALGALIYFKKWKKPDPPPATSTTSMSTSAGEANGPPADAASQVALVAATTQHVAPSSPGQSATSTETGSAAEPPGPGYLTVICKPFCDNVRCAGTSLGASPVVKSPTPAGRHRVALTKKGSRGKSMNVDIEPGKTYTLRVDMK